MFERVKLIPINKHIWLMNDANEATGYIVVGNEKAMIIDTMNGYEDVKAIAQTVTDLPLIVVHTHGHPDHIFGAVYFEQVYLHPDDWALAQNYMKISELRKVPKFLPIYGGDVFDLVGIRLEIFHIPGHTPGGICLLDRKDRILFTGDSIIEQTWLQMEESLPLGIFLEGLETLTKIRSEFDYILTGHTREYLEDASLYEVHKKAVKEVIDGDRKGDVIYKWFGGVAKAHPYGKEPRKIVYKDEKIKEN